MKKLYAIYIADDNGWLEGCPDREDVFFGGKNQGFRHGCDAIGNIGQIEIRGYSEACARLRDLNTSGDWIAPKEINPEGIESRPTYGMRELTSTDNSLTPDSQFRGNGGR